MNKKAQFYIITAVILLVLSYSFFSPKLTYKKDRSFQDLYENYIKESSFAANTGNLAEFTHKFVDYSKTKNPNFGIAYLYVKSNNITALNLIKKPIFINEFRLSFNETVVIDKKNSVTITLGSNQYIFNTTESPKISALFYSESGTTKKVYAKDE